VRRGTGIAEKSLKRTTFEAGERLGDIVDVDERFSHAERPRAEFFAPPRRRVHLSQAAPEGFVDKGLQVRFAPLTKPLKLDGNVVIEGQGRPHTLKCIRWLML
jgi:hypothetical protein